MTPKDIKKWSKSLKKRFDFKKQSTTKKIKKLKN